MNNNELRNEELANILMNTCYEDNTKFFVSYIDGNGIEKRYDVFSGFELENKVFVEDEIIITECQIIYAAEEVEEVYRMDYIEAELLKRNIQIDNLRWEAKHYEKLHDMYHVEKAYKKISAISKEVEELETIFIERMNRNIKEEF